MKNAVYSVKLLFRACPAAVLLLWVFTVLLLILSPLYSLVDRELFDMVQEGLGGSVDRGRILRIVGLYFGYNLAVFVLAKGKEALNTYGQARTGALVQEKLVRGLESYSYEVFEDNTFYDHIQTISREAGKGGILSLSLDLAAFAGVAAATVSLCLLLQPLGWGAVALSVLCCVPGFLHQASFGKKNWEFNTSRVPLQRKCSYYFSLLCSREAFGENRGFGTRKLFWGRYEQLYGEYYRELRRFNGRNCWKGVLMAILHAVGTVSVILYAYYRAVLGEISLGEAVLYAGVSQSIYNNIQNAVYMAGSISGSVSGVRCLLDCLREGEKKTGRNAGGNTGVSVQDKAVKGGFCREKTFGGMDVPGHACVGEDLPRSARQEQALLPGVLIRLQGVAYAYPGTGRRVLEGLNLEIREGEKLAVVGENGSGKTTLAKVLLGLCVPGEGTVEVQDRPVQECPRYASACFQDYAVYSLSVRENVAVGDPLKEDLDREAERALFLGGLDKTVLGSRGGEDFSYLERQITRMFDSEGLELSRGQSQKLALARAFLYGQGLIVLDEPSASMDAVTEKEIFESTLKLMEGRTAVVITHRLSNVVQCDRIVYLEGGKIVESGTHEELMKQGGRYRELFMLQAQRYLSKQ